MDHSSVNVCLFCNQGNMGETKMATVFDRIEGNDKVFEGAEYKADSLLFNAIESARNDDSCKIFTDHSSVVIMIPEKGNRVWIWTSDTVNDDTAKMIDICRFLRDRGIPKVEIYLKHDISDSFSDMYAIASSEMDYVVKDELSLAIFKYEGDRPEAYSGDEIIHIDKNNPAHVKLVTDFYRACCDEFRWHDKFDRKVEEYLNTQLYAYIRDGKMIANTVIGGHTDDFIRIKSVAVLSSERRKGLGYTMCKFIINKIMDCDKMPVLYTHVGNAAAMALWAKAGFKLHDKLYLLKVDEV